MPETEDQIVVREKTGFIRKLFGPFLSLLDKPLSLVKNDKRKLGLLILILLIPIVVLAALIQQELRSRAAVERQLVLGVSNGGGLASRDLNGIISGVEKNKTDTGRYPAIYPLWVHVGDYEGGPRASFPSKDITDALDARGIALAIFLEPVGPGIGRSDGRFIFSSNTSGSVSSGQIRFNSSNPSGITQIYVSKTAFGTENPTNLANTWVQGARVSMFGSDSSNNAAYADSNFFNFTVNSKTDSGTYWTLGVTVNRAGSLSGIFSNGRPVFITMADTNARKYANSSIANGSLDAFFRQFALDAKAYGRPVLLRYAHEMNGRIFPWTNGQPNSRIRGANGYGRYRYFNLNNNYQNYKAAWIKIHNVIKDSGASNLKMFWCPSRGSIDTYDEFYPGNTYVEYAGFDAYSTPNINNDQQMVQIYRGAMNKILSAEVTGGNKPIFVGETGVTNIDLPAGFSRSDWVRNGYNQVFDYDGPDSGTAPDWPQLAGIIYFDFNLLGNEGGAHHWLLSGLETEAATTSNKNALPAYRDIASRPRFQGRFESSGNPAPPSPTPTPIPTKTPTPTPTKIPSIISVIKYATHDSFVAADTPGKNFGGSNQMWSDGNPRKIIFIKFNLTDLAGKKINKAIFDFKVPSIENSASGATFYLKPTTGSWSETAVAFNNKPGLGTTIKSFKVVVGTNKIDLTPYISANVGRVISIGISTDGGNGTILRSREAPLVNNRPQLLIDYIN